MPFPSRASRGGDESTFAIPVIPYDRCAAKTTDTDAPGTTVLDHCRNVGCVADALMALMPSSMHNRLPTRPGLPVSMHDIGKVSPGFMLKYFTAGLSPPTRGCGLERRVGDAGVR